MASSKKRYAKIVFHRRGEDVETAWCVPLATKDHYRLANILFLHATPVFDDVIEAKESERFDGKLAFRKVVKRSGRHVAILDYPNASQFAKLTKTLRDRFDGECEGSHAGRVYVALPARHTAKEVFLALAPSFEGLDLVHPAVRGLKKKLVKPTIAKPTKKALFDAIDRNDLAAFEKAKRTELAVLDDRGRSLLFRAVLEGRTEIVKHLIARGAAVNPEKPKGFAPLQAAAMRNRPKEAKLLLVAGADPDLARDDDGDPPVVVAAFRESAAVLRALITKQTSKADLSLALLEAAGVGNLPIVKLLVKRGADPNWKSRRGNSATSIATKRKRREVLAYFRSL